VTSVITHSLRRHLIVCESKKHAAAIAQSSGVIAVESDIEDCEEQEEKDDIDEEDDDLGQKELES